MKTEWDYTTLANAYVDRPGYSGPAVDALLRIAGVSKEMSACDVGAGVGHLTIPLAERGLRVDAVEPNESMRELGARRTSRHPGIRWFEGTGEDTGRASASYHLVTFGSSFNVTDRPSALRETCRILRPGGWFACMWNHRDLADPLQAAVEEIIRKSLPHYDYGSRREDQTGVIRASNLFDDPLRLEGPVIQSISAESWVNAWRSHATLARQAGDKFGLIVKAIADYVADNAGAEIAVPYTTRIWIARAIVR